MRTAVTNHIRLVAERIVGDWAAQHGTIAGPRETSLALHVLAELGQSDLDDLSQRWAPHPPLTTTRP